MLKTILMIFCVAHSVFAAAKYTLNCRADLLKKSSEVALMQVGIRESPNNRGKMIERYLASVGLKQGHPYCAAGQYWCFAQACRLLKIPVKYIPLPRTALASVMFNYGKMNGKRVKFIPAADDLIVWQSGKTIFGHIERIIQVGKRGWVRTIGFNTVKYINGIRFEGVFIHRRNVFGFLGRMHIKGIIGFNTGRRK